MSQACLLSYITPSITSIENKSPRPVFVASHLLSGRIEVKTKVFGASLGEDYGGQGGTLEAAGEADVAAVVAGVVGGSGGMWNAFEKVVAWWCRRVGW